jgi:uncharacterized membrane protein YgaE (UPF0421/DUF939 family)
MYLEFVVGPVLSLLIALKFGDMKDKEREQQITALQEKVELLEKSTSTLESELPKKVMATMLPVAKAVQKLNQQVGL